MTRRYPALAHPYDGFEGALEAQRDGKIWLSDTNLLLPMIGEYALMQIRQVAFDIAGKPDPMIADTWPSVLELDPIGSSITRDHMRRATFLIIFSGRDDRFAYQQDYMPGQGLERRLMKEAEPWWFAQYDSMEYFRRGSRLDYPDIDPDEWVARLDSRARWNYPIDGGGDPGSAPLLMKALDCWLDDYDDSFAHFATEILLAPFDAFLEETEILVNDLDLKVAFQERVCGMVETLAGVQGADLAKVTKPTLTNQQLVLKTRLTKIPTEEDPSFDYISDDTDLFDDE